MNTNSSYSVEILVNGNPITKYSHKGNTFVEGRSGSEYEIRVTNHTFLRKEVIISVDGLDIIKGEPASEKSRGYIINGYETQVFKGWRLTDESVGKFVFGDKEVSYAAKSGQGSTNAGVIGVMVFDQYIAPIQPYYNNNWKSYWENDTSYNPTRGIPILTSSSEINQAYLGGTTTASAAATTNNLGTGMGEEITDKVSSTTFQRSLVPPAIKTIYYDSRKGLEARGIVVDTRKELPEAFPGSSQYCQRV